MTVGQIDPIVAIEPTVSECRGVFSALRWCAVPSFLRDVTHMCDVYLELQVESGWLWERGRFTIRGEPERVRTAAYLISEAVKAYERSN